ncbi:DeoR/GlpR family DNA-binding transcription regulator [Candidatus Enterococcus murrayae]|uniref:DeoR/GlpR transcriptional regulator n=1 Tax=Candidatus Enterococcus murrayae TaxID=2815321 RepID=A0ABS3HGR8_9ENTE|nr:DeoR/GlpR family DNA-binding transcription regulator [Enterococcus sp. MJM16]MBO0452631.1 DeoR/GlpR transcriptional regulator [Enterococcus sp. MJM16]
MGKVALRRKKIIEILGSNPIISLTDLACLLDVTTETIRNDLKSTYLIDKVVQAHGSVALAHTTNARDVPYSFRKEVNSQVKNKIADQACQLISPGQVVVIEHNSISVMLIHLLSQNPELLSSITVITNSFSIMQYVQEKQLETHIIFLGGTFSLKQENSFGATTVAQMKNLRADISFLSPGAINEKLEITAYKEQDAELQKEIMKSCKRNVLLVEKNKYPEIAMWNVNLATDYDEIITELSFSSEQEKCLYEHKVNVITI